MNNPPTPAPESTEMYADRLANAKTPEEQNNILTEFRSAVRDGRLKAKGVTAKEVPWRQSTEAYVDRLANAKTPEEQNNILNEFQNDVRDGRVKAMAH
jgi:hypothetical protein